MAKVDHEQRMADARRVVLEGLVAEDDLFEIQQALAKLAVRGDLMLAEMLIRLAADVIGLGGFSSSDPVSYKGFRERYLPEVEFRGKVDLRNSQYAIYAAAILHSGVVPDLLSDTGWWRSELWPHALYGLVAYTRASASHRSVDAKTIAEELMALASRMT